MTSDLKRFIEKVLREKEGIDGLEVREINEAPCSKPGDNFMSVVSAAQVLGTLPGGSPYKISLFLKRPPGSANHRSAFQVDQAFLNETVVYDQLLPLYDVIPPCPRLFHADNDVIILEDLKQKGFSMVDRKCGFDYQQTVAVLQALARFHAGSFFAGLVKKEQFENVVDQLDTIGFMLSTQKDLVENALNRTIKQLAGEDDLNTAVTFLRGFEGRVTDVLRSLRTPRRLVVLCHGDFWINNILLRSSSEDSVRFVDFQASTPASPGVDVWTLLYTSIQPSVMSSIQDFLQVYSNSFLKKVRSLEVAVEHIPSESDILQELLSKELYGLLIAMIYSPAIYLDHDNLPDLENINKEKMEAFMSALVLNVELKDRITFLVKMASQRGVFSSDVNDC